METVILSDTLDRAVTHWLIKDEQNKTMIDRNRCKKAETAAKRFKAKYRKKGSLVILGLTMHAETKPIIFEP